MVCHLKYLFVCLVNCIRENKKLRPLDIIQVDLIVADAKDPDVKLSSTFIRSLIEK